MKTGVRRIASTSRQYSSDDGAEEGRQEASVVPFHGHLLPQRHSSGSLHQPAATTAVGSSDVVQRHIFHVRVRYRAHSVDPRQ